MQTNNKIQLIEQRLQDELRRRKAEMQVKDKKTKVLIRENEQVREVKEKIERAYLNKYHAMQIVEKQARNMRTLQEELNFEKQTMQKTQEKELKMRRAEEEERLKRLRYKEELSRQIASKTYDIEESRSHVNKEREKLEQEREKLIAEEKERIEMERKRKKELSHMFERAIQEKDEFRRLEAEEEE